MAETIRQNPKIKAYPYHLPDKPFPEGKVSYEEFLDWADEDTLAEWVDGEIELSSPVSYKHSRLSYIQKQLAAGGEDYARQLIEELTRGGFLPPNSQP